MFIFRILDLQNELLTYSERDKKLMDELDKTKKSIELQEVEKNNIMKVCSDLESLLGEKVKAGCDMMELKSTVDTLREKQKEMENKYAKLETEYRSIDLDTSKALEQLNILINETEVMTNNIMEKENILEETRKVG